MRPVLIICILVVCSACKQKNNDTNNQMHDIKKVESQIEKTDTTNSELIEEFISIDVSQLNTELFQLNLMLSPKEIMKMYYPNEVGQEGKEEITISEKTLSNIHVEVTLIHDYMPDDSMRGQKYIMELKKLDDHWTVLSLKTNWKCWADRGHTNWGIEPCK